MYDIANDDSINEDHSQWISECELQCIFEDSKKAQSERFQSEFEGLIEKLLFERKLLLTSLSLLIDGKTYKDIFLELHNLSKKSIDRYFGRRGAV